MDKKLGSYNERMDALISILGKKSHKDVWPLMTDWQKSQLEHLLSVNGNPDNLYTQAQLDEAKLKARIEERNNVYDEIKIAERFHSDSPLAYICQENEKRYTTITKQLGVLQKLGVTTQSKPTKEA